MTYHMTKNGRGYNTGLTVASDLYTTTQTAYIRLHTASMLRNFLATRDLYDFPNVGELRELLDIVYDLLSTYCLAEGGEQYLKTPGELPKRQIRPKWYGWENSKKNREARQERNP